MTWRTGGFHGGCCADGFDECLSYPGTFEGKSVLGGGTSTGICERDFMALAMRLRTMPLGDYVTTEDSCSCPALPVQARAVQTYRPSA